MDGPNINLNFFEVFSHQFKEDKFHSLIDIGSCGLHIVHGSFSRGELNSSWNLKKFLKGPYHLLLNSPTRREDYESVTGSCTYSLRFCSMR